MAETIQLEVSPAEAEQWQTLVNEWLQKMQQAHEQMEHDRVVIEAYRAETRAVIAQLQRFRVGHSV